MNRSRYCFRFGLVVDEGTIYFRWGRKPTGMGTLGSYTLACRDLPTVNIISLIHKRAAVMQPLATSTISCWQPVWYHWKPKPQTETTLVANMVKQVAAAVLIARGHIAAARL